MLYSCTHVATVGIRGYNRLCGDDGPCSSRRVGNYTIKGAVEVARRLARPSVNSRLNWCISLSYTFKNLDIEDFRLLYKTYIRRHLEFCIQAWSPHFVKDITILENVQKAATNLVPRLRKYSYPVRLRMIGITSLVDRRIRGDMIEVYKLLTGKEKIDYKQFFNFRNAP